MVKKKSWLCLFKTRAEPYLFTRVVVLTVYKTVVYLCLQES